MSSTETWQELLNLLLYPRRSTWTPKRALPCNESGHSDRPLISAIVQSFGDGRNARQLATRLERLPRVEVLVNDDSRRDHAEWLRWLRGPNSFVLSSPNVHEIRAYDRLARLARGDYLLLLQGDFCLPRGPRWLEQGLALFERFPKLGLVGGMMGFDEVPLARIAEDVSWGVAPCKPIERRVPAGGAAAGTPFSFVAGVNIGPLLARREAFLRVGGFDEAFSCAGQPGIHLDTELSLQMWRRGYQVGLWYSAVANGVGGRKTRTNPEQKRARLRNDNVNGKRCERLMRSHDAAAVAAANAQLEAAAADADARRALRETEMRLSGLLSPAECGAE